MPHNTEKADLFQPMAEELTPFRIQLRLLSRQSLLVAMMLIVFICLSVSAIIDRVLGIRYRPPDSAQRIPVEYRIDVNSATWIEFAELPGVGETLARRIVSYREERGGFQAVEELDDIPGVGKITLERIRPMLRLPNAINNLEASISKPIN